MNLGEKGRWFALLAGPAEGDTLESFRLGVYRGMLHNRSEEYLRCIQQAGVREGRQGAYAWIVRTLFANLGARGLLPVGHAAMMFPFSAAAGRQLRFALDTNCRQNQREAEKRQQQCRTDSLHFFNRPLFLIE